MAFGFANEPRWHDDEAVDSDSARLLCNDENPDTDDG